MIRKVASASLVFLYVQLASATASAASPSRRWASSPSWPAGRSACERRSDGASPETASKSRKRPPRAFSHGDESRRRREDDAKERQTPLPHLIRFMRTIIATMGRTAQSRMEGSSSRGVCGAVAAMVVAWPGRRRRRAALLRGLQRRVAAPRGAAGLFLGCGLSGGERGVELGSAIRQRCSLRV